VVVLALILLKLHKLVIFHANQRQCSASAASMSHSYQISSSELSR